MRDSFVFYRSFLEAAKFLPADLKAKVLTAIIEYALNGVEDKDEDPVVKSLLMMAKPQIDKNNVRYENGKKGGRPKNNQTETEEKPNNNQETTKEEPKNNQTETKQEPNVNVNVNDNVNNNISSLDREECKNSDEFVLKPAPPPRIDYEKIVAMYHSICIDYPKVIKLGDHRKQKMRIRFCDEMKSDYSLLENLFKKMQASKFMKGDNKQGWKATFDWVFENGQNWVKVLEGNYDNKERTANNNSRTYVTW